MSLDDYLKAAGPYAQDILAARSEFLRIRLNLQPEIRKIYARAADRLAREIKSLPKTTGDLTRNYLQALEKALRSEAGQLNADLTASLRSTIEQSVAAGLKPHVRITTKLLQQASVGLNMLQAQWAFAAVNARAVEAIWARARKGLRLSDRIWNIAGHNMDAIRDVILDSVTMGRDAVKVARDLEQYLKVKTPVTEFPNMMKRMGKRVPKDITYEALRLARTEMTAAFGEGTIAGGHATASYRGIRWVLSAAHPEPDVCNELAHGGPDHDGVYPRGDEPPYPAHPNCLAPDQPVLTARGSVPIQEVEVGDAVLTGNGNWREVTTKMRRPYEGALLKITTKSGKVILVTPDHRLATMAGWVEARSLQQGDRLLTLSGSPPAID